MGRRNPLTDWAQFFLGERYPWRNQTCQIWWRSLKGFRGSCGSNFSISHGLCWSSLQHSHTTVWACDPLSHMYLLLELFLFLRKRLWINMLHLVTDPFPFSNLDFISKILERLFLARIQSHITSSPSFNQYQSAYRRHHSTETPILHTLDSILLSSDSGKSLIIFGNFWQNVTWKV